MSSTLFVTGATGFLGSHVVDFFHQKNQPVIAQGRNLKKGQLFQEKKIPFISGDLSDPAWIFEKLPQNATVIHCAALSSPWGTQKEFYNANVLSTKNIIEAAFKNNAKRLIHISTPSVYVEKCSKLFIKESDPLPKKMMNLYAETKLQAEALVLEASNKGLEVIILRPQGIFGPRDETIFPRIIRLAQKGFIPKFTQDEVLTDLTYVENVVHAIDCAILSDKKVCGEIFNITNHSPVDLQKTIFRLLSALNYFPKSKYIKRNKALFLATFFEKIHTLLKLKSEPLLTTYSVCSLSYSRTLDFKKAEVLLNYKPLFSFEEGFQKTIESFQSNSRVSL